MGVGVGGGGGGGGGQEGWGKESKRRAVSAPGPWPQHLRSHLHSEKLKHGVSLTVALTLSVGEIHCEYIYIVNIYTNCECIHKDMGWD